MKRRNRHFAKKWLLFALFVGYMGSITFFTHTHIINHISYVHSHPYKKSEKKQHKHTENQLFLLEHLYHTQITPDVIPGFDLSGKSKVLHDIPTILYEGLHPIKIQINTCLRAPPAA